MSTQNFKPSEVVIADGRRARGQETVAALAASIEKVGLLFPPEVRLIDGKPHLIHGAHRIAALIKLGKGDKPVAMTVAERDAAGAAVVEAVENLHRAELTVIQRDEEVAKLSEVIKTQNPDADAKGGRGRKGVAAMVAELTGLDRKTVNAALNRRGEINPDLWAALREHRPQTTRDELDHIRKLKSETQDKLRDRLLKGAEVTKLPHVDGRPLPDEEPEPFDHAKWERRVERLFDEAPRAVAFDMAARLIDKFETPTEGEHVEARELEGVS